MTIDEVRPQEKYLADTTSSHRIHGLAIAAC